MFLLQSDRHVRRGWHIEMVADVYIMESVLCLVRWVQMPGGCSSFTKHFFWSSILPDFLREKADNPLSSQRMIIWFILACPRLLNY